MLISRRKVSTQKSIHLNQQSCKPNLPIHLELDLCLIPSTLTQHILLMAEPFQSSQLYFLPQIDSSHKKCLALSLRFQSYLLYQNLYVPMMQHLRKTIQDFQSNNVVFVCKHHLLSLIQILIKQLHLCVQMELHQDLE